MNDPNVKHNYTDYDLYLIEVVRIARKMNPSLKNGICTDTVRSNFNRGTPVGMAAKSAASDSSFWELGL